MMWVCLNDCFLSIVHKDCARDELLVRARRPGDIEKVFGKGVKVRRSTTTDYLYRAAINAEEVARVVASEVRRITYGNFKDSVADKPLHDAYLRCWFAMSELQPTKPYSGKSPSPHYFIERERQLFDSLAPLPKKNRKKRRSIKRGR